MEMNWFIKARLILSLASGVLIVGFGGARLLDTPDPYTPIALACGAINLPAAIGLVALCLLTGVIGYLVTWPYGRRLGILAVPAGLTWWAMKTASVTAYLQGRNDFIFRQSFYAAVRFEPLFWLLLVMAGFAGVFGASKCFPSGIHYLHEIGKKPKNDNFLTMAGALIGSVVFAQVFVSIFAQDFKFQDTSIGMIHGQPLKGQVIFGVFAGFAITAFIIQKFFARSYLWPILGSGLVSGFAIVTYMKTDVQQQLSAFAPVFYSTAVAAILPVQIVSVGALGAIYGYWLAVRYEHWRKHEMVEPT